MVPSDSVLLHTSFLLAMLRKAEVILSLLIKMLNAGYESCPRKMLARIGMCAFLENFCDLNMTDNAFVSCLKFIVT